MKLFSNGICPICNKNTNLTNKSSLKIENDYLCMECTQKLANEGITLFNIKNKDLAELKNTIHKNDVKKGNIIECPKCNGHNIELLANDKNYTKKYKTTININPLKIFTLTNTKEIKKETSQEHNEYLCKDCGNRWIGK